MKRSVILLAAIVCALATSCRTNTNNNRVYFDPELTYALSVPLTIGDSTAKIHFDTGCPFGYVFLDSTFCEKTSFIENAADTGKRVYYSFAGFASHIPSTIARALAYKKSPIITIGGSDVQYDYLRVHDFNMLMKFDGTLGFPKNDTAYVWELNFGDRYLELHAAVDFVMPADCFVLPLTEGARPYLPHVRFPIKIESPNGDTVTIEETYLLDTGLAHDIVLTPNSSAFSFFENQKDPVLITTAAGYRSRYIVGAKFFEDVKIDSLRVYTDQFAKELTKNGYGGMIGLNFLKRFNLFFDFRNGRLGFQPTGKKFERGVNPFWDRFYYATSLTKDERCIVTMVSDMAENPFKEAGLLVGDEIVAWDGVNLKALRSGQAEQKKCDSPVFTINIIRDGMPLQLICRKVEAIGE